KGMPREAMTRVHAAMLKVLRSAEISERMSRDALDPVGSTPREFADYLEREAVQWARAVRISGAKAG
ncbi:MAG TPA: tripartite tricarboxylate transporter substrate binding protein, partial [Burkholderiales bacterium]|nr:tripartite tricarboxylate transporter substrate binding protein [Burkholderiales bacterium]